LTENTISQRVAKRVNGVEWHPCEPPAAEGTDVKHQNIWSPRYIDSLILRDADADDNSETGDLGGTGVPVAVG